MRSRVFLSLAILPLTIATVAHSSAYPIAQTAIPSPAPPAGKPLTKCRDITVGGIYYLKNDVSSPGVCFGIDANNITLNLNQHTITYGTGGGTEPTPAIEGHDSYWKAPDSPMFIGGWSGDKHGGLEVYGGNIVESPNAAPFSDVFSFGQGGFNSAPYIHDVTATFGGAGAEFYYSTYLPSGARIENNIIYDNVKSINMPGQADISARSAFQGQAIDISGTNNNPATHGKGDIITGNKIVGSPQGGIRTVDQYSVIDNNNIDMNSRYANDWCIEISADHTLARNNNCHPASGRGINIDASHVTVQNNIVTATELPQIAEYGGCEGSGDIGIRVESMPVGGKPPVPVDVVISNNTITLAANACMAVAFDFIYLEPAAKISVKNNVITTTNGGKGALDAAFQFDDTDGTGISITENTVSAINTYILGEWDGYNNVTVGHNIWKGSPQYTFVAADGACEPSTGKPGSPAICPVAATVIDDLPNTVHCGPYSTAKITIDGKTTQCKKK